MMTSRVLLVGLLVALAACSDHKPAPQQAIGRPTPLRYDAALLTGSLTEFCTQVDAYSGTCIP
jgi:hypothetical protein